MNRRNILKRQDVAGKEGGSGSKLFNPVPSMVYGVKAAG